MPNPAPFDPQDDWIANHPLGLLVLDDESGIQWVNPTLLEMLDAHRDELIGLPRPTGNLEVLLGDDDVMELTRDGRKLCLRRHQRTLRPTDGPPQTMLLFEDLREVTILHREIAALRETIAAQSIQDPLTGLPNQRGFLQLLEQQVTRSRRYNNPLSLMAVRLRARHPDNTLIAGLPDGALLATAQTLRDRLRWADSVGRWNDDTFLIALPETSLSDAGTLIEKIEKGLLANQSLINQRFPACAHFGQAEWKPRMDARALLDEVLGALDSNQVTLSLTG